MAAFCLLTGQSPQTYKELTALERDEFTKLASSKRRR